LSVYIKDPEMKAKACVIWMHGLGADSQDMIGLAEQLQVTVPCRHVFMDAPVRPVTLNNKMPMRAWYDISGMELTSREDADGIKQSEGLILKVMDEQIAEGFDSKSIFFAGFSQGAAMALFTGLNAATPIAGIIALSGYIPLASSLDLKENKDMPIFIGGGLHDPIVLPLWTNQCVAFLKANGYQKIEQHTYPMEHAVCASEINDLSSFLSTAASSISHRDGVL